MSIRWGFVGSGRLIPRFMGGLQQIPEAVPAAIFSPHREHAQAMAEHYHIAQVFDDFEQFLAEAQIDIAHIALPHHLHMEYAQRCLQAKIPTLCEKPLCANAKMARELIQCARENDTFLAEGFWSRYFPISRQLKQWLQEGRIGKVVGLNIAMSMKVPFAADDRLFDVNQAGGAMADMGIYPLAFADSVFGRPPQQVTALSSVTGGIDDNIGVVMKYDQGEIAIFYVSFHSNGKDRATIYGTEGMIEIFENYWRPRSMKMTCRDGIIDFNCPEVADDTVYGTSEVSFHGEGFQFEIRALHDCLRQGLKESPEIPLEKSLEIISVCDEIRRQIGVVFPFD